MASDPKRNKDLIRRMNDEVWDKGNLDLIDEHVADDYVEHNTASPEPIEGPDGYKENVQMVHDAFSDVEVTTEHLVAEDDLVAYHYSMSGTHEGQLMQFEPTGNRVEFSGMGIARIEDGQVVESWSNVDVFGMMQQIGAIPDA